MNRKTIRTDRKGNGKAFKSMAMGLIVLLTFLVHPPQRGVGLREPNLGKTNPRVSLH